MIRLGLVMLMLLIFGSVHPVLASPYIMFESVTNSDGALTWDTDPLSDPFTGKTWNATFNTAGDHYFGLFLDAEIGEPLNTYFNEFASATGIPAAGLSWEIDEPGYVFGDIYDNFTAGSLDNSNGVPSSAADDVSMALMWHFSLLKGQTAFLDFFLETSAPSSGFYLAQFDSLSAGSLYFSSSLRIEGGDTAPVPEPSTFVLFATALAGLGLYTRRRRDT